MMAEFTVLGMSRQQRVGDSGEEAGATVDAVRATATDTYGPDVTVVRGVDRGGRGVTLALGASTWARAAGGARRGRRANHTGSKLSSKPAICLRGKTLHWVEDGGRRSTRRLVTASSESPPGGGGCNRRG
jgi:hypothetical protein